MNAFASFMGMVYMFIESCAMAIENIMQNRLRSFLTILGIMIGVTAVISLITTISGVSNSISSSFTSMGAGSLTLTATGSDLKEGLDDDDFTRILALEHVRGLTPNVSVSCTVTSGKTSETSITATGTNAYYFSVHENSLKSGRKINSIDTENMARVCLINKDLVESFFYGVSPIGQTLYLNRLQFTVIGIFESDSSVASLLSGSAKILMPYSTALKMNNASLVNNLTIYMDSANASDEVEEELGTLLDEIFSYEDDTYTITTMDSIEETMNTMMSMMSALLGGIASIALVVGGIGIMNMMLTSVTERTVEIGLKKAIGAEPGQIQIQFLIESFLLSMIGGLCGVALGIGLSALMCHLMGTNFVISYGAILLGVGFSAAVGIIFGWSPARKASKLSPIDALRRM
ncbi:MAG: ABC transporter permease [Clostridia bacterium]|nr:ABC transporter permease [Clostridia bacterium]